MKSIEAGFNNPVREFPAEPEGSPLSPFPLEFSETWKTVKLEETRDTLTVGAVPPDGGTDGELTPLNEEFWKRFFPRLRVRIVLMDADEFASCLRRTVFPGSSRDGLSCQDRGKESPLSIPPPARREAQLLSPPSSSGTAVNLVNGWLIEGIRRGASDIHIDAEDPVRIRFRQDGVLADGGTVSRELGVTVLNRIKYLAGMNLLDSRMPQEGRFTTSLGERSRDIRVSLIPTVRGASLVLRLLGDQPSRIGLEALGFEPELAGKLRTLLRRREGLLVVCGPTGSGKTTTLNTLLEELVLENLKIISLEDPVEYRVAAVSQIQADPAAGLTFPVLLRRILRQDPDVLLVGEIRDGETAALALRAALTGHLVLTTLHAGNLLSVPDRLMNLGVPGYLVASVLRGVLGQRLVRRLCPDCSGSGTAAGPPGNPEGRGGPVFSGEGRGSANSGTGKDPFCRTCGGTGYRGRTVAAALAVPSFFPGERFSLWEEGWKPQDISLLKMAGRRLAERGITSREELLRAGVI